MLTDATVAASRLPSMHMQAHYPLIQRVAAAETDATNGTATQAGGPNRYLLQANYTGAALHILQLQLCSSVPAAKGSSMMDQKDMNV